MGPLQHVSPKVLESCSVMLLCGGMSMGITCCLVVVGRC